MAGAREEPRESLKSIVSSSPDTQIVILSPDRSATPSLFIYREVDASKHNALLQDMQRLRGSVYLSDGAIQRHELTADGRHALDIDRSAWHILILDGYDRIQGCIRILNHPDGSTFDDLWACTSALCSSGVWGWRLRRAVESEMNRAHHEGRLFAEVGGWAVAAERRGTSDALRTILAGFALLELIGGARGIATATARHGSARVLRRLGLSPFVCDGDETPAYFDPQFGCEMEFLSFDSRYPNPRYRGWVMELMAQLQSIPVIMRAARQPYTLARPFRNAHGPADQLTPSDAHPA